MLVVIARTAEQLVEEIVTGRDVAFLLDLLMITIVAMVMPFARNRRGEHGRGRGEREHREG